MSRQNDLHPASKSISVMGFENLTDAASFSREQQTFLEKRIFHDAERQEDWIHDEHIKNFDM